MCDTCNAQTSPKQIASLHCTASSPACFHFVSLCHVYPSRAYFADKWHIEMGSQVLNSQTQCLSWEIFGILRNLKIWLRLKIWFLWLFQLAYFNLATFRLLIQFRQLWFSTFFNCARFHGAMLTLFPRTAKASNAWPVLEHPKASNAAFGQDPQARGTFYARSERCTIAVLCFALSCSVLRFSVYSVRARALTTED